MSTTLVPVEVGIVDVKPGFLMLNTSESAAAVLSPGFLNSVVAQTATPISRGDFVLANYDGSTAQSLFTVEINNDGLITLDPIAGNGAGAGGVDDAVNLGTGEGLFTVRTAGDLNFKSLKAGTNVTLTPSADEIEINAVIANSVEDGVNLGAGSNVFAGKVGQDLTFRTLVPGVGVDFDEGFQTLTINAPGGGGGGGYVYDNTYFVASNGSDTNTGKSMEDPLLTFQAAITKAEAVAPGIGQRHVIVCNDCGTYTNSFAITLSGIDIFAPNASISSCAFYVSASANALINGPWGNRFTFNSFDNVTFEDTSTQNGTQIYDSIDLTLKYAYASIFLIGSRSAQYNIDYYNDLNCTFGRAYFNALSIYGFNITSTGLSGGYLSQVELAISQWFNVYGTIGGINLAPGNTYFPQTSQNIGITWAGGSAYCSPTTTITLTLTLAMSNVAPVGWTTYLYAAQNMTGRVNIVAEAGVILYGTSNTPSLRGPGNWIRLTKVTGGVWLAQGEFGSASSTNVDFYVSKLNGDDVLGDGTQANPYATIMKAITEAGAPANPTNIFITDGETYDESVVISNPNINIIGVEARLIKTGGGDALTITTSYPDSHGIILGAVIAFGGGLTLNATNSSFIIARIGAFGNGGAGAIEINDNRLFITSENLQGAITVNGPSGTVLGNALQQSGVLTPNSGEIKIITPEDVSSSFNVKGKLTVSDAYTLDSANGSFGQVQIHDGINACQWGPMGGVGAYGIYVSKLLGSDAAGDGSMGNPYASLGAAIAAIGAPANPISIYVIDGETYDENVTIASGDINIFAPQAFFYSTTGDFITYTGVGTQCILEINSIGSAGGLGVVNNSAYPVSVYAGLVQGAKCTVGALAIDADFILGDLDSAGQDILFKCIGYIPGTVTGSPKGISASGNVGNDFKCEANIISETGYIQAVTGDMIAGSDGTYGRFVSYPNVASSGALYVQSGVNLGAFDAILSNQPLSVLSQYLLPKFDAANFGTDTVVLMPSMRVNNDPAANLITFDASIPAAALAGGASLTVAVAFSGATYRIRELFINYGGVNFSGGGGDRNIQIDDGITQYSIIPAATLAGISTLNAGWGSTDLPYPATVAINTVSSPSLNLSARYNGGTTDYATGTLLISGMWERVG